MEWRMDKSPMVHLRLTQQQHRDWVTLNFGQNEHQAEAEWILLRRFTTAPGKRRVNGDGQLELWIRVV